MSQNTCSCNGDPIECNHEAALGHAEAAVARVRALHAEYRPGMCRCANPYPCPTIVALDGGPR